MRPLLGIFAAILALLGLVAGLVEWSMPYIVKPDETWNTAMWETLQTTLTLASLVQLCGFGFALILVGVAVTLPVKVIAEKAEPQALEPQPESPPVMPADAKHVPKEETRAAEDLWQSADAPFPAPPSIDHPSAGPSLWQSDQAPFPKVDVPEDEEGDNDLNKEDDETSAKREN